MPARRKEQQADDMYKLYQQGYSLADVARAFSVNRQSVYKMFARRHFVLRTVKPLPFIVWSGIKYTRRPNGYYARTNGERRYLHQDMWEQANGPIPEGSEIHHKDGDQTHNSLENFELLTASEHGQRHGFAGNQYRPTIGHRPVR